MTDYVLTLVEDQDRRLRLNPKTIKDSEHLFGRIERRVTYPKHQDLLDRFNSGEDVPFGKLTIHRDGLVVAGRAIPWAEIREVELSPKLLIVRFHGRVRRVFRVSGIPFPWALIKMLRGQGVRIALFDGFKAP